MIMKCRATGLNTGNTVIVKDQHEMNGTNFKPVSKLGVREDNVKKKLHHTLRKCSKLQVFISKPT